MPTTLSPAPTTTVPLVVVPNALAYNTPGLGEQAITSAGFQLQIDRADSGACWITFDGHQQWDTNAILSQFPEGGANAPAGSTVTLQVC